MGKHVQSALVECNRIIYVARTFKVNSYLRVKQSSKPLFLTKIIVDVQLPALVANSL